MPNHAMHKPLVSDFTRYAELVEAQVLANGGLRGKSLAKAQRGWGMNIPARDAARLDARKGSRKPRK